LNGPFGLASGKSHLLYRYHGEPRRITPWKDFPIDVLGDNGYAIAAPSDLECFFGTHSHSNGRVTVTLVERAG